MKRKKEKWFRAFAVHDRVLFGVVASVTGRGPLREL